MIEVGNNSVNGMFVGASQVARMYLGADLVYDDTAPPVGRTINVGTGSGMLTIDGANLTYEGSPTTAQPGDTIIVAAGTYTATWPQGSINIINFDLPSGFCTIKAAGTLNLDGNIQFRGSTPNKGVGIDFRGTTVTFTTYYPEKIIIDEAGIGGYERIKVQGISYAWQTGDQYLIRHKAHNLPFSSGVAIKDLEISDITISGSGFYLPIAVGDINDDITLGYCEDVKVHDITCEGPAQVGTHIWIGNTEGFEVYNIWGDQVQLPEDSFHGRFVYCKGRGDIYNVQVQESGGAAAVIQMFSRVPGQVCRIYNVASYNSKRYSSAEFRSHASTVVNGQTYVCSAEGDFVSFWTTYDTGIFSSTAFDVYTDIATNVQLRNSVAVNPKGVGLSVVNDNGVTVPTTSNNIAVADNSTTLLSAFMVPGPGSILIGGGVGVPGITTDAIGTERPDPPTIGALEGFN